MSGTNVKEDECEEVVKDLLSDDNAPQLSSGKLARNGKKGEWLGKEKLISILMAGCVLLIFGLIAVVISTLQSDSQTFVSHLHLGNESIVQTSITDAAALAAVKKSIVESEVAKLQTRPEYDAYTPALIFGELPAFPTDFYTKQNLLLTGKIDFNELGEEYWKQPEFYPNWGTGLQNRKQRYTDPMFYDVEKGVFKRFGAWGYGAYPASRGMQLSAGSEKEFQVIWYTGWTVETVQGFSLVAEFTGQTNASLPGGVQTIVQDSELAKNALTIEITPKNFEIGRAFPLFSNNWAVKANVRVTVAEDAEQGTYFAVIHPVAPSPEFSKMLFDKYLTNYVPVAEGGVNVDPAMQVLVVEVV